MLNGETCEKALEVAKKWSVEDVVSVFSTIRLEKYCDVIKEESINGFLLTDLFLNQGLADLGMSPLHQARLRNHFADIEKEAQMKVDAQSATVEKAKVEAETETKTKAKVEADVKVEMEDSLSKTMEESLEEIVDEFPDETVEERMARLEEEKKNEIEAFRKRKQKAVVVKNEKKEVKAPSENLDLLMFTAIRSKNEEEVCNLLAKKADPNRVNSVGEFPLHNAIMNNSHLIVALLLYSKADSNMCTSKGLTALELADRKDMVMRELLTQPVRSMELDSPYNQYHKSADWREARALLMHARTYIGGTKSRIQVDTQIPALLDDGATPELGGETEFERWMRMIKKNNPSTEAYATSD